MASAFGKLYSVLWYEKFWLPTNQTWDVLISTDPNLYIPRASDLYISILLGVIFVAIRVLYERWVVAPFASYLGIKSYRKAAQPHPLLEQFYLKHGSKYDQTSLVAISKQTDWEQRKIQRWIRVRSKQNIDADLAKFGDCAFHFLAYAVASIYGFAVLWDKSWVTNTIDCWMDWPHMYMTPGIFWYYQGELGLYWCLVFRVMTDHRRKDFAENVIHHITTMLLLSLSFVVNLVRIGTLVLLVHDVVDPWLADILELLIHHIATMLLIVLSWLLNVCRMGTLIMLVHDVSDPWLAMAKMAKYAKKEKLCLYMFVMFTLIWIVTRLGIYPFYVLYSTTYEIPSHTMSNAYYLFVTLLYTLLVLHLMWTYMILRTAVRNFTHGEVDDLRSDSDASDSADSVGPNEDEKRVN